MKKLYPETDMQNIADAIRQKLGVSTKYKTSQMASAVLQIETQDIEELHVTENGTYTASAGVDGYSPITVNVSKEVSLQTLYANEVGTFIPGEGYDGFSEVIVGSKPISGSASSSGSWVCSIDIPYKASGTLTVKRTCSYSDHNFISASLSGDTLESSELTSSVIGSNNSNWDGTFDLSTSGSGTIVLTITAKSDAYRDTLSLSFEGMASVLPVALEEKTLTVNGTYTADDGYSGFSKVSVDVHVFAFIHATYTKGAGCTCECGETVLTATDASGNYIFEIPAAGTWTVKCGTVSEDILIIEKGQSESVNVDSGYFYIFASGMGEIVPLYTQKQNNAVITETTDNIAITISSSGYQQTCIRNSAVIDLTDYSTLVFDMDCSGLGNETAYQGRFLCSSTAFTVDKFDYELTQRIAVNTTRHLETFDISGFSGSYYLGTSGAWAGHIYNIYLM